MNKFNKHKVSIKDFLINFIKKTTLVALVVSIGLFQSIEFKLDVKATSISVNPFEAEDQYRETVTNNAKGKENALSRMSTQAVQQLARDRSEERRVG